MNKTDELVKRLRDIAKRNKILIITARQPKRSGRVYVPDSIKKLGAPFIIDYPDLIKWDM